MEAVKGQLVGSVVVIILEIRNSVQISMSAIFNEDCSMLSNIKIDFSEQPTDNE